MKVFIASALLHLAVFITAIVSKAPYDVGTYLFFIFIFFTVSGAVSSLLLSAWYKGDFKTRVTKATKLTILLLPASYILGYVFILIESAVRK